MIQMIKEAEIAESQKINGLSHINPTVISNKFHQFTSAFWLRLCASKKQFYVVEKKIIGATPVF
jgi:hypothetical protein